MLKERNQEGDYKIKLVYYDFEGNLAIEGVWGVKEGDYYRLKNIPFFAPNLSYNDIISVEDDDGELFFDSLIEASGHSTLQIIFFDDKHLKEVTDNLVYLSCSWEGSHLKECISVDVPKYVNYSKIRKYLEEKRKENILDFKEACLSEDHAFSL